ncbi:MAG TPA: hypothetical protein ENK73_07370 [Thiomicrospira sp.]|nr:hypothetical protein [Thiomicrospira sp.]
MTIRKAVLSLTVVLIGSIQSVWAVENSQSNIATPSFTQLLEAYKKNQPQQLTLNGIQQLHKAQKDQATSWVAGDVNVVLHHETDALTGDNENQNWQVGAEFPIRLPSQKTTMSELVELSEQRLPIETQYLNWLASEQLRQLMWTLKTAQVEVQIVEERLSTSEKLLKSINKQVELGETAQMDAVLAEQITLKDRTELLLMKSNLMAAENAFFKWTGFKVLPASITEAKATVETEQHPQIRRLTTQLVLANSELKQLESEKSGQPSVYFGAQQDHVAQQTDTSLVMELVIPLGMDSNFGVKVAQQRLLIQQNRADLVQAKQNLALKQHQAEQRLNQLQKTLELTEQQLNLAMLALEMSSKAYQLGEISIQNLLQTQQHATEAKRNAVMSQLKLGQAIANYNQISGHILGATNR